MKPFRKKQPLYLWWFSVLLLLNGCGGAEPECDSLDTRNSLVRIISDNSNNALVNYTVKNSSSVAAMVSSTNTEAEKLAIWEKRNKARLISWMTQYLQIQETGQRERLLAVGYCM
jgi:hypothetical protein